MKMKAALAAVSGKGRRGASHAGHLGGVCGFGPWAARGKAAGYNMQEFMALENPSIPANSQRIE